MSSWSRSSSGTRHRFPSRNQWVTRGAGVAFGPATYRPAAEGGRGGGSVRSRLPRPARAARSALDPIESDSAVVTGRPARKHDSPDACLASLAPHRRARRTSRLQALRRSSDVVCRCSPPRTAVRALPPTGCVVRAGCCHHCCQPATGQRRPWILPQLPHRQSAAQWMTCSPNYCTSRHHRLGSLPGNRTLNPLAAFLSSAI